MFTNEWKRQQKKTAIDGIWETKKKGEAEVQDILTLKSGGEKVST